MKKILLSAAVALVALTANAQEKLTLNVQTLAPQTSLAMKSQSVVFTDGKQMHKAPAKAEAEVLGFVEINIDWLRDEDETQWNPCSSVTITKTGEMGEYEGEEMEKVHIEGLAGGYATVDGFMTEERLCIPVQKCYEYTGYGDMNLEALIVNEQNQLTWDVVDLTFTVDEETGFYVCDQYGWVITMTGDYDGSIWSYNLYTSLVEANGVEYGTANAGSGYGQYENCIYIEDLDDEIHVYGFYAMSHIVMYPDSENPGAVLIPTFQTMEALGSNVEPVYGYDIHTVAYDVVEGTTQLSLNEEREYLNAEFVAPNEIAYVEDEYCGMWSNFDEESRGYRIAIATDVHFTLTDGSSFITGIKTVNADKKASKKTFNLMGQEVAPSTKGLVIKNGVKVLNK